MSDSNDDWILPLLLASIMIALISANLGHSVFKQTPLFPPVAIGMATWMLQLMLRYFADLLWLKIVVVLLGIVSILYPVVVLNQPLFR